METYDAEVIEDDEVFYLSFNVDGDKLRIPLTKDEPNEIKSVFNKLIIKLKKGEFEFSLEEKEDGDIFYHIAQEYVSQLNLEMKGIYKELSDLELLEKEQYDDSN